VNWLAQFYAGKIHSRRARILADAIAGFLPPDVNVLDVGCGDGLVANEVRKRRSDIEISGIDVLVREHTHITIQHFDGHHIPLGDRETDIAMFIDVLHHTRDPGALMQEALRTARVGLLIKDHLCRGILANRTLRFMDRVSNTKHGIYLPDSYWTPAAWQEAFDELSLQTIHRVESLGLYPPPFNGVFGHGLHFIGRYDRK
jgi:SAM-dependent methyltransferase